MTDKKAEQEFDFQEGLERLEEIVDSLEGGKVELEKALKVFAEGVLISQSLAGKLDKAEKQIRKLVEKSDGSLETEPFEEEKEEE